MARSVLLIPDAWEQYQYWHLLDIEMVERINILIKDCRRSPFEGKGKPEPLKGQMKGYWSRRIDKEHRLVYKVYGDILEIAQCRFHYSP
jgi:toxin YoeB